MDEPKQSVWKKEISFKRKPKAAAPPDEPKQSVWKKDISFKRKPKAQPPPPASEAPSPATAPPDPFDMDWLTASLDALAAGEPLPAAPVPATEPEPVPEPEPEPPPLPPAAEPAKTSLLKKEISFKRKPKAEKAPKAEKPPKPEKPKRERGPKPKPPKGERKPKPARGDASARKLPKCIVGLKVGASQLAAARVANNGHAQLEQVAREELDRGIVVAGELREPEALAAALRAFFKKHKLPRRGVRLGIANNRIGVRIFEIGGIDDPKQLANAIRFRAQEALPIPIEEAVLDYRILDESRDEEGNVTTRVLLVVAYRELIDRYVGACRKAGITLVGIDLEAFALLRSLAAPPEVEPEDADERHALVAVSVGHERSTFAVSDGRICEFTRVLDWGGGALDVAIARELGLTPMTAEPVKRALSLGPAAGELPEGVTEEQLPKAREAVRRQIQSFARELVSSLQFYQNQPGSLGIGEIVLTGGTAHLDGLAEELQRLIGVRVRVGDPLARVSVSRRVKEPEQVGSLAIAIGLGIED